MKAKVHLSFSCCVRNYVWVVCKECITGVEVRLFCLTGHFKCWRKSNCSSPIATKGCNNGAVTPLFCPALQKINLSTLIWFNSFLKKYRHALSSCSQHPWHPKQNKDDNFARSKFQDITQCYSTQTHKIKSFWFINFW